MRRADRRDLNPEVGAFAPPGTRVLLASSDDLRAHLTDASVDVVFASNFFEHLPSKDAFIKTLAEILRAAPWWEAAGAPTEHLGGRRQLLGLHRSPHCAERSFVGRAVEMTGFTILQLWPRFLPYTTRSKVPQHPLLVRLYLAFPPAWRLMGGQTWLVATR